MIDDLSNDFWLLELKANYQRATECLPDPEKERSRLKAIATKEHSQVSTLLTQILNTPGIKQLFFGDRILCRGLTGNPNKASLLRVIVCRWLTNDRQDCFLKYRPDIGYCFWHSAKDFAAKTGISIHTIYKLIPQLAEEGWIEIFYKQDAFGRVKWHIKLQVKTFFKRLVTYIQSQLVDLTNCNSPFLPILSYINQIKKEKNNIEREDSPENIFSPEKENTPAQATTEAIVTQTNDLPKNIKPLVSTEDSRRRIEVPQVEEKVNKENMGVHKPKGDRHFGNTNYLSLKKERAKMQSVVGMSGFKDIEDLRKCQRELTMYFAKKLDPEKAADKASWMIRAEKQGERSPFVQDYLDGLAIGSWCIREWEIEPGRIKPVFLAYLRSTLRKGEDTREQCNVKVGWYLKNSPSVADAWSECKRIVDLWRPRLINAQNLGQNLNSLQIPEWIVDTFRPEIPIEQVTGTADALASIAESFGEQRQEIQKQLEPSQLINPIADSNPLKALSGERSLEERIENLPDQIFEQMPSADPKDIKPEESALSKINSMLKDKILRPRGLMMAKQQGLPILTSDEGVAVGIDYEALQDNKDPLNKDGSYTPSPRRSDRSFSAEGHGDAHRIYKPQEVKKGSKSAWEAAKAKSKFLQSRGVSMPK